MMVDRPRHSVLYFLAAVGLSSVACPDAAGPPEPTGFTAERSEPERVALSVVDAVVPRDLGAYEAFQVHRVEGAPKRVIVERFVRGQCYRSQSFARLDDSGYFLPEGPPLEGLRAVNPTVSQEAPVLLIRHALERDQLPHRDQIHVARHGRQQPAWTFARVPAPEGDDRIIQITTTFGYETGGCTLPPRLGPRDVPAPRIADLPTTEVIARRHAVWEPVPGTEGRYVTGRGPARGRIRCGIFRIVQGMQGGVSDPSPGDGPEDETAAAD